MTALIGLDLNGLWDWAAIHEEETGDEALKDLGVNAACVRLASNEEAMVAGPQTVLAPHGRGQGWADLGHERLRLSHAAMLRAITVAGQDEQDAEKLLKTLFRILAERARSAVIAVPDDDSVDEAARERMLQALHRARAPSPSLLWRPVAATLGWAASETPSPAGVSGARVAVVSILRERVHFGALALVKEDGRFGPLIVPERRRAGAVVWSDFGGLTLATWAAQNLARETGLTPGEILAGSRSPWTLSVGQTAAPELFRMTNRSWMDLTPLNPPARLAPEGPPPEEVRTRVAEADVVLIEGAGAQASPVRRGVLEGLGVSPDDPRLRLLDPWAVAQGSLEANHRLRRGDPAYYDFLPQLQINALVQGKVRFVSLIPPDTRLRGGAVYRAEADGEFAIGKGAHQLEFYLIKEDFNRPRKSTAALPEISDRPHRISVSVDQSPGQGFARVRIGSNSFAPLAAQPIELDWTQMAAVEQTPEDILATLQSDKGGAYPNAQIYLGHAVLWHPNSRHGDIAQALTAYSETPLIEAGGVTPEGAVALKQVKDIASKSVMPSYEGVRLGIAIGETTSARFLNTNGDLPEAAPTLPMPAEADGLLSKALEKAALDHERLQKVDDVDEHVRAIIGFATWCYWRCPDPIVEELLRWYEAGGAGKGGDLIVRLEGLGRVVHCKAEAHRFYQAIERRLVTGQPIRNAELAALTRLLGSVEEAADWLSAEQANRFLQATQALIEEQNAIAKDKAYKQKFKYALLMLASLLRRRRMQPDFLDPDNRAAQNLERLLKEDAQTRMEQLIPDFRRRAGRTKGRNRQRLLASASRLGKAKEIISELIYFLHKEGRDPNIIQRIDEMEE
ncbi:hypothetical protein [Minwuia thermotolerans]|uniref:hypothetical protein n=1 Tax=Minwuia thermotolerans TaxID=2056226 RepID=UPI000D6DC3A8|nr:hypothetical protein [Minwuia thermotolerans]